MLDDDLVSNSRLRSLGGAGVVQARLRGELKRLQLPRSHWSRDVLRLPLSDWVDGVSLSFGHFFPVLDRVSLPFSPFLALHCSKALPPDSYVDVDPPLRFPFRACSLRGSKIVVPGDTCSSDDNTVQPPGHGHTGHGLTRYLTCR